MNEPVEQLPANKSPLDNLISILRNQFPYHKESEPFKSIDSFQKLESRFSKTIYESNIYFLARRIVTLACYTANQTANESDPQAIKAALEDVFDLKYFTEPERLFMAAYECFKESNKKPTAQLISRKTKEWLTNGHNCYICGTSLNPKSTVNDPKSIEVEHVLPRSLGAGNQEEILKPACNKCNGFKKDRIGPSDIHIESLAYKFEIGSQHETDYHRFAARFFNGGQCDLCGSNAETAGNLVLQLREPNDSWHLFNIYTTCPNCTPTLAQ